MMMQPAGEGSVGNFIFLMLISTWAVLAAVWLEPLAAGRFPKALLFLGSASYSLYLFHPMIAPVVPEVLDKLGITNGAFSVVLCLLAAIAATSIIYKFVEVPVTRGLQDRLPYMREMNRKRVAQPVP
jgi:peptidoglycan/LPS O-acetylase OafA/YrhL